MKSSRLFGLGCPLLVLLTLAASAFAQTVEQRLDKLERENAELRKAFSTEVERLQFGQFVPALGDTKFGMGPAASKVYNQDQGLSIGGYGEFLYEQRSGNTDRFDALRSVLYVGYRFNENWVLNSEFEFEHGSTSSSSGTTSSGGSTSVEFSYLEYLAAPEFNVRAGLLLVPLGFINLLHEPTTFLSAQRPETERRLIPSTWRENGVSILGEVGPLRYRVAGINSLEGSQFDANGLRGGRQKGNRAAADDFALASRLDWTSDYGLTFGVAGFIGKTGQDGRDGSGMRIPDLQTTILEAHAEYQRDGLFLRALYATALLENTAQFNMNTGNNLAQRMEGYYAEAGYNVAPWFAPSATLTVSPFVRFEQINTQKRLAAGYTADASKNERIWTAGINIKPIEEIVIKVDFQSFERSDDRLQISFGYIF